MDSLQINTGEKRIAINNDPTRMLVFNPSDVIFAERFYKLIGEFEAKFTEYQTKAKAIEAVAANDANGFPVNTDERIALIKDACSYIKERIDILFGIGSSQIIFGDAMNLDMFSEFFTGITPFIQQARSTKIAQYTTVASVKRNKHKK